MENSLYIDKIREFIHKEKTIKDGLVESVSKEPKIFEIKNVSFSYGSNKDILKNINLTIKPREKIALVGHNGSGKTMDRLQLTGQFF